jgi:deoxyribodipyrimidine photo-lyase
VSSQPVIIWFRQDLRIHDNPALIQACKDGALLPLYILDDTNPKDWKLGGASRVWLHHALMDLNNSLDGNLHVFKGNPLDILQKLTPKAVHWNRCYEPWRMARDKNIKQVLQDQGIEVTSHNASLLWEPWEISKKDGTPYKVFTPYYRKGCLNAAPPRAPYETCQPNYYDASITDIASLSLLDALRDWPQQIASHWDISETGAQNRLQDFLEEGLTGYKTGRDFPAQDNISRLAPYLHFGQISPHQVWHAARLYGDTHHLHRDVDHFCSELAWREFSYSLLFYNQDLPQQNLHKKFDPFPWREDEAALKKWQTGQTGYPIIDAGMRELWQTGFMHNRVRMICASFLIKNLLIPWRVGEDWFWDTLFDADLANNAASWQWVAGCGADAAPYFRIFNPVTQSQKFDPDGQYIRRYVPELRDTPDKYIHTPWLSPTPPTNYPVAMVDLQITRKRALAAYDTIK